MSFVTIKFLTNLHVLIDLISQILLTDMSNRSANISTLFLSLLLVACSKETEVPIMVVADFWAAGDTDILQCDVVSFNSNRADVSTWEWTFEGGTPSTANTAAATVYYETPGNYAVTLKVTNVESGSQDVTVKEGFVKVSAIESPFYAGTVWVDTDIITTSDPTVYEKIEAKGQEMREMYDRRVEQTITLEAHVFEVTYSDGKVIEILINPEISATVGKRYAEDYGKAIGRLPEFLREGFLTVAVHRGDFVMAAGGGQMIVHVDNTAAKLENGFTEEMICHESGHLSLFHLDQDDAWRSAQQVDPVFISDYAAEFPTREDVSETILFYLAVKYKADRISEQDYNRISCSIPNRIALFDAQNFAIHPWN